MSIKVFLPFVAALALIASCGGSSSSGDTGSGTTPIDSLTDVPDAVLNPQVYDLTTQSASLAAPISKDLAKDQQAGGFSRAGCETDVLKKNIIRNAILPRMILCNIRALETAAGGAAAGSGTFNYWKMDPPEGEQGPSGVDSFDPRVAIKQDGTQFVFVLCNGATKSMELVIDTANNVYSGHVIDKWGDNFEGMLEFSADGLPPDSFTLASFTQSFNEVSHDYTGYGSATLQATPDYNVVFGFQSGLMADGGSFGGATYAKFNATEGTAKYRMDSGTYPGQTIAEAFGYCQSSGGCSAESAEDWIDPVNGWLVNGSPCSLTIPDAQTKLCFSGDDCPTLADENGNCAIPTGSEHSESFTINNSNPLSLIFAVANSSVYSTDVAAATAPSSVTAPTIEFTSASAGVDCSVSESWSEIPFTSEPDMTACREMEEEMNNWHSGESCANQDAQNEAAQGSGQ